MTNFQVDVHILHFIITGYNYDSNGDGKQLYSFSILSYEFQSKNDTLNRIRIINSP